MSGGDHLDFVSLPKLKNKRTSVWEVNDRDGNTLGQIKWWTAWRRYTFHPCGNTLYDPGCLRAIADFCETQTTTRRRDRRKERESERSR